MAGNSRDLGKRIILGALGQAGPAGLIKQSKAAAAQSSEARRRELEKEEERRRAAARREAEEQKRKKEEQQRQKRIKEAAERAKEAGKKGQGNRGSSPSQGNAGQNKPKVNGGIPGNWRHAEPVKLIDPTLNESDGKKAIPLTPRVPKTSLPQPDDTESGAGERIGREEIGQGPAQERVDDDFIRALFEKDRKPLEKVARFGPTDETEEERAAREIMGYFEDENYRPETREERVKRLQQEQDEKVSSLADLFGRARGEYEKRNKGAAPGRAIPDPMNMVYYKEDGAMPSPKKESIQQYKKDQVEPLAANAKKTREASLDPMLQQFMQDHPDAILPNGMNWEMLQKFGEEFGEPREEFLTEGWETIDTKNYTKITNKLAESLANLKIEGTSDEDIAVNIAGVNNPPMSAKVCAAELLLNVGMFFINSIERKDYKVEQQVQGKGTEHETHRTVTQIGSSSDRIRKKDFKPGMVYSMNDMTRDVNGANLNLVPSAVYKQITGEKPDPWKDYDIHVVFDKSYLEDDYMATIYTDEDGNSTICPNLQGVHITLVESSGLKVTREIDITGSFSKAVEI